MALLVAIWFVLGISAVHLAIKADGGKDLPYPCLVWLAVGGPVTLVSALVVCVQIAIEKGRES